MRGLAGLRRALWALVPMLFAVALVCWLGPGRLFPKELYEDPALLVVSRNHALTLLDRPGYACAGGPSPSPGGFYGGGGRPEAYDAPGTGGAGTGGGERRGETDPRAHEGPDAKGGMRPDRVWEWGLVVGAADVPSRGR